MLAHVDSLPPPDIQDRSLLLLLCSVANRDRTALAELFDREAALVLGVLCRLVGDTVRAEECLLRTFVRIWQRADSYRPELGRPRTWILMMACTEARAGRSGQTEPSRLPATILARV